MQEVSVIVLTKNSEKILEDCLKSITKNGPSEIIIIDDGSTDRTLEISKKWTDQIYHNGKGVGFGRQLGVQKATSKYIAYVDSDMILPDAYFERMFLEKLNGGYHAIQAQTLSLDNSTYWAWAENEVHKPYNKPGEQGWVGAGNTIFDKDVLLEYGFDPTITSSEDSELSYRLKLAGYKLGRASVGVLHLHRLDYKSWTKQKIWRGKGKAQFVNKYWRSASAIRPFLNPTYSIIFSLPLSIMKYHKLRLFPYILLDGVFQEVGLLSELTILIVMHRRRIDY